MSVEQAEQLTKEQIKHLKQLCIEGKTQDLEKQLALCKQLDKAEQTRLVLLTCKYGQLGTLQFLHKNGFDIHCESEMKENALHIAAINNQPGYFIDWLTYNGVNLIKLNANNLSPRDLALKNLHPECFKIIADTLGEGKEYGNDKKLFSSYFFAEALKVINVKDKKQIINSKKLLQCDSEGRKLFRFACESGNAKDIESILQQGVQGVDANKLDWTKDIGPLFFCVEQNDIEKVRVLIDNGAVIVIEDFGVNYHDDQPLLAACKKGNLDIITLMLDKLTKSVPVLLIKAMIAALMQDQNLEVIKKLLPGPKYETHKNLPLKQEHYNIAFEKSCLNGQFECVQYLLEDNRANKDAKNEYDDTILHFAVGSGNLEVIDEILKHSPDQNVANHAGKLPIEFFRGTKEDRKIDDSKLRKKKISEHNQKIQDVFNKYSHSYVVALRKALNKDDSNNNSKLNKCLKKLAQFNSDEKSKPIYQLALELHQKTKLSKDDQKLTTEQSEIATTMFYLACNSYQAGMNDTMLRRVFSVFQCYRKGNIEPAKSALQQYAKRNYKNLDLEHPLFALAKTGSLHILKEYEIILFYDTDFDGYTDTNKQTLLDHALANAEFDKDLDLLLSKGVSIRNIDNPRIKTWLEDGSNRLSYSRARLTKLVKQTQDSTIKTTSEALIKICSNKTDLASTLLALCDLLSSNEYQVDDIKNVLEITLEKYNLKNPVAHYALLTILEHAIAITNKTEKTIDIKALEKNHSKDLNNVFDLACYCNMHHIIQLVLDHDLREPYQVEKSFQIIYERKNKTVFEKVLHFMLDKKTYINDKIVSNSVIPAAIEFKCYDMLEIVCGKPTEFIDHKLADDNTALHIACRNNDPQAIKILLLSKGGYTRTNNGIIQKPKWSTETKNKDGKKPLELITDKSIMPEIISTMVEEHHLNVIQNLEEAGYSHEAFLVACRLGKTNVVKFILRAIKDPQKQRDFILKTDASSNTMTGLHYAAESGNPDLVFYLYSLHDELPIDYVVNNGSSPMQLALAKKDCDTIASLVKQGETPPASDDKDLPGETYKNNLQPLLLLNAQKALQRTAKIASSKVPDKTLSAQLITHSRILADQVKDNSKENITLLTDVRNAIENNDVDKLSSASKTYQKTNGTGKQAAAIFFSILAIALLIVGISMLTAGAGLGVIATIVGAIALAGAVGSGAGAGTLFYKSRNNSPKIAEPIEEMGQCLVKS